MILAEDATLGVLVVQLGAKNPPRASNAKIDFRREQHAERRSDEVDP